MYRREDDSSRWHLFRITIVGTLLGGLILLISNTDFPGLAQAAKRSLTPVQAPSVTINTQNDSPLSVITSSVRMVSAFQPELDYTVTNVSGKPIQAFALVLQTKTKGSRFVQSVIRNSLSTSTVILPGGTSSDSFGGSTYVDTVTAFELSVDYVEFTDGTVWGKDEQKSSTHLVGQRAGAKAAKQLVSDNLRGKTTEEIETLLEEDVKVNVPSGQVRQWEQGFQSGVDAVRHKLRTAKAKGGTAAAQRSLAEPFDVAEERSNR